MKSTVEALALIVTGVAALSAQMVYFLLDDREPQHTVHDRRLKIYWHWAGGAIHIWMGYVMGKHFGAQYGLVMTAVTWFVFDGFINTYVLHREWWYIGQTAWIDVTQREIAAFLRMDARLFSAILKIIFLIGSILFLCLKKSSSGSSISMASGVYHWL